MYMKCGHSLTTHILNWRPTQCIIFFLRFIYIYIYILEFIIRIFRTLIMYKISVMCNVNRCEKHDSARLFSNAFFGVPMTWCSEVIRNEELKIMYLWVRTILKTVLFFPFISLTYRRRVWEPAFVSVWNSSLCNVFLFSLANDRRSKQRVGVASRMWPAFFLR